MAGAGVIARGGQRVITRLTGKVSSKVGGKGLKLLESTKDVAGKGVSRYEAGRAARGAAKAGREAAVDLNKAFAKMEGQAAGYEVRALKDGGQVICKDGKVVESAEELAKLSGKVDGELGMSLEKIVTEQTAKLEAGSLKAGAQTMSLAAAENNWGRASLQLMTRKGRNKADDFGKMLKPEGRAELAKQYAERGLLGENGTLNKFAVGRALGFVPAASAGLGAVGAIPEAAEHAGQTYDATGNPVSAGIAGVTTVLGGAAGGAADGVNTLVQGVAGGAGAAGVNPAQAVADAAADAAGGSGWDFLGLGNIPIVGDILKVIGDNPEMAFLGGGLLVSVLGGDSIIGRVGTAAMLGGIAMTVYKMVKGMSQDEVAGKEGSADMTQSWMESSYEEQQAEGQTSDGAVQQPQTVAEARAEQDALEEGQAQVPETASAEYGNSAF